MYYDLDSVEEFSEELGFSVNRLSADALNIEIFEGVTLEFLNLQDTKESLVGFYGTPWHCHDKLALMTGKTTYVELDELDIIQSIKSGVILVVERYLSGNLNDRWMAHKDERMDFQYIEPGEELRIRRLA